ncbi:HAD-like protein [Agrocybe pediades]|nr:HAD-like protein [Agrocybe pediades]
MAQIKAEYVLFDMDGLMIDSESIFMIAANESLKKYGKELTWDIKAGCLGKSDTESAKHIVSSFPDTALTMEEFVAERDRVQLALWSTTPLLPGVRKLVLHLKKHNIPMAVATSSRRRKMELKTAHLQDVIGCFDGKIVCGDDEQYGMRGKPWPDLFLTAAGALLGRDVGKPLDTPTETQIKERSKGLVLEDATAGVQAAKRAGMSVVWVPEPHVLALDRSGIEEKPDLILGSLEEFVPEEWGLPPYDDE